MERESVSGTTCRRALKRAASRLSAAPSFLSTNQMPAMQTPAKQRAARAILQRVRRFITWIAPAEMVRKERRKFTAGACAKICFVPPRYQRRPGLDRIKVEQLIE